MKTVNIIKKKHFLVADIILLRSDVNYTHIFFKNGKQLTVAKTLKEMEPKFIKVGFFRTHKSYLVNPNHILDYYDVDSELLLSRNLKANVSRRRKEAFEKTLP